jgi:hypothetical protein
MVLAVVAAGCGATTSQAVAKGVTATLCEQTRHGDAVVIAAYESTVGEVRAWADQGEVKAAQGRFPGRSADESVGVCWYDGPVGKSPPGPGAVPFDRYVTMVDEHGRVEWIMAGYRDRVKPEPPTS